ncbi:MAG: hypothetical protein QW051_02425 [Candidatus Aenigmatarchaeota archaeon]
MKLTFKEIFTRSLKYPLRLDVFVVIFFVNLIFGILGWFITIRVVGSEFIPQYLVETLTLETLSKYLILLVPLQIIFFVIMIFLIPMYFENIYHFYKGKRKALHESFETSKKRFLDLFILSIIFGFIILVCFGGLFLTMYSLLFSKDIVILGFAVIWFIIGSIIAIILGFMMFTSPIICVLEKSKPIESLKKSWSLISKNKLKTFGFWVILILIYFSISLITSIPDVVYLHLSENYLITASPYYDFIFSIIRIFVNSYLTIFFYSSIVFFYLSLRKKFK